MARGVDRIGQEFATERSRAMGKRVLSMRTVAGLTLGTVVLMMAHSGQAQAPALGSDRAAGFVVFPKVVVDTGSCGTITTGVCDSDPSQSCTTNSDCHGFFHSGSVDTVIQLATTSTVQR